MLRELLDLAREEAVRDLVLAAVRAEPAVAARAARRARAITVVRRGAAQQRSTTSLNAPSISKAAASASRPIQRTPKRRSSGIARPALDRVDVLGRERDADHAQRAPRPSMQRAERVAGLEPVAPPRTPRRAPPRRGRPGSSQRPRAGAGRSAAARRARASRRGGRSRAPRAGARRASRGRTMRVSTAATPGIAAIRAREAFGRALQASRRRRRSA